MKVSRRAVLVSGGAVAVAAAAGLGAARVVTGDPSRTPEGGVMPEETEPHARTYMAWPTGRIWGPYISGVRADVARIARTIAAYEPVTLLANEQDVAAAAHAVGSGVRVLAQPVDDLWARDTGPVFVRTDQGLAGIDFRFNGWGEKQQHRRDRHVAAGILTHANVPRIQAPLTAEGGSLEVDGRGTLLATESSLVNDNRNPGKSRDQIERELKKLLGLKKVIWIKGLKNKDITDYHIDALARFAAPGTVVMSSPAANAPDDEWRAAYEQARGVIESSTDADGRRLTIVEIPEADPAKGGHTSPDFLASYINYYVANGAVIAPKFGDTEADAKAARTLKDLYPTRELRQLDISTLASGGGGIHCATQQQPEP